MQSRRLFCCILALIMALLTMPAVCAGIELHLDVNKNPKLHQKLQKPLHKEIRQNIASYIGPHEETDRMSFRALSEHATRQARAALQALGYYHPDIVVSRKGSGNNIVCVVTITPGVPVLLRQMDIRIETNTTIDTGVSAGSAPAELTTFVAEHAPRQGEIFHHGRYAAFKNGLLQQALRSGYFDAVWRTQQARVDPEQNRVDISLVLSTGARYRVGKTTITGTGIHHELIARFPRFKTDDEYDGNKITELHRDLLRTGWFEAVHIQAEPDPATDHIVPVNLEYSLRKRNRVGIGAGFSTDIGPRVQLQWEKPWLNARGHSLSTYAEVAEVRSQFEASYLVPLTDPVTSQMAYSYGVQVEDLNTYQYWLTTAGIEHRKRLPSQWRLTRSLELNQETDDFGLVETRTTLLMPGVSLSRTDANGAPLITRGWRTVGKIRFAADALASDADMVRATLDGKAIYSLGDRTRTILRAGAGAMSANDILDIPVSLRFFSGGDQSIRGYDYQSIAPVDSNNAPIGGLYKLESSLEFDYRLADRWLIAVFADYGSSFNDFNDSKFFTGAGTGIRWLSLIGPLRLDFAWGLSLDQPSFNLHFYMGPEL